MNMTPMQARQFMNGLSGIGGYLDPYPTDTAGNALTETAYLTAEQIACLTSGAACTVQLPANVVRDPVTGQVLNPSTGLPYPGQGANLQTLLLIAAAAVIVYLLMRKS